MFRNIFVVLILSLISICCLSFNNKGGEKKLQKQTLRRIVIDPGHGGIDPGTKGSNSEEKDVALAVALKLQKTINEEMPEVEVVMTRTTDIFDKPRIKANKANQAKGDLFISIHCNEAQAVTHKEPDGYKTITYRSKGKKHTKKVMQYSYWTTPSEVIGTETYIWGIGKNSFKEEALKENDFFSIDSASDKELSKFNPNDPEQRVEISLRTQQYAERSRKLAVTVEEEFEKSGRVSRGAKQRDEKGIWVLQAVAMPAILIEIGFLSNLKEEAFLTSEEGQQQTAETIVKALKRYKYSLDNKTTGSR
jgi:N-acetylmuramoyl-L-alanine amidase